jgi:hypothetical protein
MNAEDANVTAQSRCVLKVFTGDIDVDTMGALLIVDCIEDEGSVDSEQSFRRGHADLIPARLGSKQSTVLMLLIVRCTVL